MDSKNKHLTDEELLKVLTDETSDGRDSDEDIDVISDDPILHFISHYKINSGEERIAASLLYDLFVSFYHGFKIMSFTEFKREYSKYIEYKNGYSYIDVVPAELAVKVRTDAKKHTPKLKTTVSQAVYQEYYEFLSSVPLVAGGKYIEWEVVRRIYTGFCKFYKRVPIKNDRIFREVTRMFFQVKYKPIGKSYRMFVGVDEDSLLRIISVEQIKKIRRRLYKSADYSKVKLTNEEKKAIINRYKANWHENAEKKKTITAIFKQLEKKRKEKSSEYSPRSFAIIKWEDEESQD